MTSTPAKSSTPDPREPTGASALGDSLSQLQLTQLLLEEIRSLNKTLGFIVQRLDVQHRATSDQLSQVRDLVNGFTSGGASFSAYQVDGLTAAYLSITGPLIAARLANQGQATSIPQLTKGSIMFAKELMEELAAYRSQRLGVDYLEEQSALVRDPWNEAPA